MTFVEHNNREKANKFAEYVTGKPLREYLAQKVKQYCGENISVFDGAAGSGRKIKGVFKKITYQTLSVWKDAN